MCIEDGSSNSHTAVRDEERRKEVKASLAGWDKVWEKVELNVLAMVRAYLFLIYNMKNIITMMIKKEYNE